MYAPEIWGGPDGYGVFLDLLADAALGDQSAKGRARAARRRLLRRVEAIREADYDNGFPDGYFGNQCADTEYPGSFAGFRVIDAYARAGSRFGPFWWWVNNGCTDWPVAEDRYIGPWETRTSKPVLVVGNYFDGVTGYTGARAVNQQLANSRLLSYAGWGHTAYGRNDCATAHIDAYLVDGTLPRGGDRVSSKPESVPLSAGRPRSAERARRRGAAELAAATRAVDHPRRRGPGRPRRRRAPMSSPST